MNFYIHMYATIFSYNLKNIIYANEHKHCSIVHTYENLNSNLFIS